MPRRPLSDDEREELTAYLDGEADRATRARVEARLNSDPALRAEADALKKAWDLLDQLPRTEPSPTFTTKTLDKLAAIRPAAPATASLPLAVPGLARRGPWVWAAAIAGGLAIGWWAAGAFSRPGRPGPIRPDDPLLVRELRLIDALPLYDAVETLEFLQSLDTPDRFGADSPGS
jgi:hypothetical protein